MAEPRADQDAQPPAAAPASPGADVVADGPEDKGVFQPSAVVSDPNAPDGSVAFQYPKADVSDWQRVKNYWEFKKASSRDFKALPLSDKIRLTLGRVVPFLQVLPKYGLRPLGRDVLAGLTVGAMLVPQGLSYAGIVGLPPVYGLYAGFSGLYMYALFGSSRQLQVGPVALISLMTASAINDVGIIDPTNETELYAQTCFFLAYSTGLVTMLGGFLRLGFILNFISDAVVLGFISATAIIIMSQQIKNIFAWPNYKFPRSELLQENIEYTIKGFQSGPPNWNNFAIFMINFSILMGMKLTGKYLKKGPKLVIYFFRYGKFLTPLFCVIFSTLIVWAVPLATIYTENNDGVVSVYVEGVPVVGNVPGGLPSAMLGLIPDWSLWKTYANGIITITLLGHIEAVAIARNLATKNRYELSHNGEMFSLGWMNVFGAFFQSYPLTGSFSRSAVNNEVGAQSQVAGAVTATVIGLTLLVLTPLFKYTPQACLAAIIWFAIIFLIEIPAWIYMFKTSKKNFFVALLVATLTSFLGVDYGIYSGIAISVLFILYDVQHPNTAILGRLPGTQYDYVNVNEYDEALLDDGLVVWKFNGSLWYPTVHFFKSHLNGFVVDGVNIQDFRSSYLSLYAPGEFLNTSPEASRLSKRHIPAKEIKAVLLDFSGSPLVDISGAIALIDVAKNYQALGVGLFISGINVSGLASLERTGAIDVIGRHNIFVRFEDAIVVAKKFDEDQHLALAKYDSKGHLDSTLTVPLGGVDEVGLKSTADGHSFAQPSK